MQRRYRPRPGHPGGCAGGKGEITWEGVYWIVQDCFSNEAGWADLLQILEAFGLPHSVHSIVSGTDELAPKAAPVGRVLAVGSYALRRVVRANNWTPGVFDLKDFTHADFWRHWDDRLLNAGTETELRSVCDTAEFRECDPFFLRPANDEKPFPGRLFTRAKFEEWSAKIARRAESRLHSVTRVMISAPREIYSEFRTWIIDGRAVTGSSYKLAGLLNTALPVDDEVTGFAEACARIWSPRRAFCLDIAKTPGGLKIVEANTINFAGFYAANVGRIVEAIEGLSES